MYYVLSYVRVEIHLEHQNTFTKRMKCADFSALAALSSMACREDTGTPILSLNTYMPTPVVINYSVESLAKHALALRHQHLWCLTITSVTCG